MAKAGTTKRSPQKGPRPRELRRRKIFESLHDCILAEGYGNTSLQDIANRADMTASHLCYYFNGKEEILQEYFGSASNRILKHIAALSEQEPREQIHSLADFWFKGKIRSAKEIGIISNDIKKQEFVFMPEEDLILSTKGFDKKKIYELFAKFLLENPKMLKTIESKVLMEKDLV